MVLVHLNWLGKQTWMSGGGEASGVIGVDEAQGLEAAGRAELALRAQHGTPRSQGGTGGGTPRPQEAQGAGPPDPRRHRAGAASPQLASSLLSWQSLSPSQMKAGFVQMPVEH